MHRGLWVKKKKVWVTDCLWGGARYCEKGVTDDLWKIRMPLREMGQSGGEAQLWTNKELAGKEGPPFKLPSQ